MTELESFKDQLKDKSLGDLKDYCRCRDEKCDYEKPFAGVPETVHQAIFAWHLAMERAPAKGSKFDTIQKAEWERYWLSCCVSGKCDYYFGILASLDIDREQCIEHICEKGWIWRHVAGKGKEVYFGRLMKFLLRRYSVAGAYRLLRTSGNIKRFWVHLAFPRIWGASFIGLLPLVTQRDMWQVPNKMLSKLPPGLLSLFCFLFVLLTFLYLCYECSNASGYGIKTVLKRSIIILIFSALPSAVLSGVVCCLGYAMFKVNYGGFFETSLFFAAASMFIGIIIQVFWEEKTITEPL